MKKTMLLFALLMLVCGCSPEVGGNTISVTLDSNNGNTPLTYYGEQGDSISLPVPTRRGNGITAESLNATRYYEFVCWYDQYGNEYAAGNMYSFPSEDVVLNARWKLNIAFATLDKTRCLEDLPEYFNGTNDYSSLERGWFSEYVGSYSLSSAESDSIYTIPSSKKTTGYSFYDMEGNKQGSDLTLLNDDVLLVCIPNPVNITYVIDVASNTSLPQIVPYGFETTLLDGAEYIPNNYEFVEWNTEVNGSGNSYLADSQNKFISDINLYAQVHHRYHSVTFNANGGEGTMEPITGIDERNSITLPACKFTSDGPAFIGWNTKADGSGTSYEDEFTGKFMNDIILYAQWNGSAGGIIFYDKGEYSDGWRYLEAAPEDISVGSKSSFSFGYYKKSSSGSYLYVNESTYVAGTYDANDGKSTGTSIGTGKANTEKLVRAMESSAYLEGGTTTSTYAAKLCADYSYGGYDDWFLPSKDELNLMYINLKENHLGSFADYPYWSSSESLNTAGNAWRQYFSDGGQIGSSRSSSELVRAVRAF